MPHVPPPLDLSGDEEVRRPGSRALWRWWPVVALIGVAVAAHLAGLDQQVSLAGVARNRHALRAFVDEHWFAAILCYAGIYVAMTIASFPAAAVMSIAGGFLFGWWVSAPLSMLSATFGATTVFFIVRNTAGRAFAAQAGPIASRLRQGVAQHAFYYLLSLRLLPVVPFCVINAGAGLCRVKPSTFIAATLVGIIPGALAYSWLGTGLDKVIVAEQKSFAACVATKGIVNCHFELAPSAFATPQLVVALIVLSVMALLPLAVRYFKFKRQRAA
jgi:uncharacterized membrane protein YdjX (TVP38/TMEM64 family)